MILQVVNQGSDVHEGNFDLLLADGGFGLFDACTNSGTSIPQYGANASSWGSPYGGVYTSNGCKNLPKYPTCMPKSNLVDNLQSLCNWTFANGFRPPMLAGPRITKLCQVTCPTELWQATGLHRADDQNIGYTCNNTAYSLPTGGNVTRMMDCTSPSYVYSVNVRGPTVNGYSSVVPCRRDGYTRINEMPSYLYT